MDGKFFNSLFEGDSANGVKLGMGLTGGDFWPRPAGCQNLYRGESINTVDFDNLIAVVDADEGSVVSNASHQAGENYLYVLRRANCCGDEDKSLTAAVKTTFDGEGDLEGPFCNRAFGLKICQLEGLKAKLLWFYCSINQTQVPDCFNVYGDGGSGQIDYENAIASVDYSGPRCYEFQTGVLSEGRHMYCVRAVSESGSEEDFSGVVKIQISASLPQGAGTLGTALI